MSVVEIPYKMYYGNYGRGSWTNSAVSFLDVSEPGKAYGRAWLIREDQLNDIHAAEGKGTGWYPDLIELEPIDGIRAVTFSNRRNRPADPISKVSSAYLGVLMSGMRETYPEMEDRDIIAYLRRCGKEH